MESTPPLAFPRPHPDRLALGDEVHARPSDPLPTPCRASLLAVLVDATEREAEREHLAALLAQHGVAPPSPDAVRIAADLGPIHLQWERHGEFSGYVFVVAGLSPSPFRAPAASLLPTGWLEAVPGRTLVAAHAKVIAGTKAPDLPAYFEGSVVVGADVGDGAGSAYTDFRLHADGWSRFVVVDRSFTPRQAGRTLQRLFDIESYRMLALLSLPIARALLPRLARIEAALGSLTDRIAGAAEGDEALLAELGKLAADIERERAACQFRFGASRAYHGIVRTRIAELRERRLAGMQTIDEFMSRRLEPAMATIESTSARLADLSERVARASNLLSARVEIVREQQNLALLASMDRRARLQLRLQQTVEWLSVAAVTYYAAGVAGYVAKALNSAGVGVKPDVVSGLTVPVVGALTVWLLHRARARSGPVLAPTPPASGR